MLGTEVLFFFQVLGSDSANPDNDWYGTEQIKHTTSTG